MRIYMYFQTYNSVLPIMYVRVGQYLVFICLCYKASGVSSHMGEDKLLHLNK